MKAPLIAFGCIVVSLLLVPARAADEPKADKEQSLNELSLDVEALQAIYALKLTDEQLKIVANMARETAEPERRRSNVKGSDEFLKVLTNLRDALIDAGDDDKIGDLEDEFDQLLDKEKAALDNSFDVTNAARKRTPEVLKLLKVDQLASFYESESDDLPHPLAHLTRALEEVRGLEKGEWRDKRDEIADGIAWAVAGIDAAKGEKINDKVVALLCTARSLSDDEFKTKKADLEKEAKAIVGEIGSDEVLRHHAERTVAEMLSNPRLEAAIKAKLK